MNRQAEEEDERRGERGIEDLSEPKRDRVHERRRRKRVAAGVESREFVDDYTGACMWVNSQHELAQ